MENKSSCEGVNKNIYTLQRVRLSSMYEEIGNYLKEHGDVEVRSIGFINGSSNDRFELQLTDLYLLTGASIGEIKIKSETFQYTQEEWDSCVIKKLEEL